MAARLSIVIAALRFLGAASAVDLQPDAQQQPLPYGSQENDLLKKLVVAEIVPNIIDVFTPQLSLSVFWDDAQAELGNTISPSKMREPPFVNLSAPSSLHLRSKDHPPPQLTLVLTDPDAPSHSNPKWSQVCHWIATQANTSSASLDLVDVMPWKAPGPPPKTGKHRYIFVVLAPVNGTSERLHLRKPAERFHWGWEKGEKKNGVRDWAIEMGLGVVGANFVYAQNEKQ